MEQGVPIVTRTLSAVSTKVPASNEQHQKNTLRRRRLLHARLSTSAPRLCTSAGHGLGLTDRARTFMTKSPLQVGRDVIHFFTAAEYDRHTLVNVSRFHVEDALGRAAQGLAAGLFDDHGHGIG